MFRFLGIITAAIFVMLAVGRPASAQPAGAIAFAPLGAGLEVDGVQFSVADVVWDGVSYNGDTSCNASSVCLYMAPGGGLDPSIVIEAANGSTLTSIKSYGCSTSSPDWNSGYGLCVNGAYDLSANVTATVVTGKPLVAASVSLTGSAPAGDGDLVSVGEPLTGAPGCLQIDADLSSGTGSCAFTTASTSVTGYKDIGIGPAFYLGNYTLATVTESFTSTTGTCIGRFPARRGHRSRRGTQKIPPVLTLGSFYWRSSVDERT